VDSKGEGWKHKQVSIKILNITHACVCEFLEGERDDVETPMECNMQKNLPPQKDIKAPSIKNHFGHTWYNVMFRAFSFTFQMSFTNTYDPYHKNILYV
jgi:hypothetical protein